MMPTALGIGLLVLLLVALLLMVLWRGRRARSEKSLLNRLRFQVPEGFSETHRRDDAILLGSDTMSLDVRVAAIPEDARFDVYLVDLLAALQLPFDSLVEPEGDPPPGWSALCQRKEEPNLYVLYRQVEANWVFTLLSCTEEGYEEGVSVARNFAYSLTAHPA